MKNNILREEARATECAVKGERHGWLNGSTAGRSRGTCRGPNRTIQNGRIPLMIRFIYRSVQFIPSSTSFQYSESEFSSTSTSPCCVISCAGTGSPLGIVRSTSIGWWDAMLEEAAPSAKPTALQRASSSSSISSVSDCVGVDGGRVPLLDTYGELRAVRYDRDDLVVKEGDEERTDDPDA